MKRAEIIAFIADKKITKADLWYPQWVQGAKWICTICNELRLMKAKLRTRNKGRNIDEPGVCKRCQDLIP